MEIRKLHKIEIRMALDLVWKVFIEVDALDYTLEGIEGFRRFISYEIMVEQVENEIICFWGSFSKNELTGVIATRGISHICLLFVKKEYHRQGIAKGLFHAVLEECKSKKNISAISVNSSPYALEVYHRFGFIKSHQEQNVNGMRFTPMLYSINISSN